MTETVLELAIFFISVYALLPTILARFFQLGAVSRIPEGMRQVAITFDDGPDPEYTPQVLNILKEFRVKACFFILGEKARKYPELLLRIYNEGHEIASHGYRHHISWLLGPRGVIREIKKSSAIIKEITGQPPRFYRPPWGLFNLYAMFYHWLCGHRVVLWSFMSWDWGKRATPESIIRKVLSHVRDGSILVFHDSDTIPGAASGAPARMLSALPVILKGLNQRGLRIIPLTRFVSHSFIPRSNWFWKKWESIFQFLTGIEYVLDDGKPTVFRLALRKFRGAQLLLPDGSTINKGDLIGELHLNNQFLQQITVGNDTHSLALLIRQEVSRSLPALARLIATNHRYQPVKGVVGLTILHRGSERFGFTAFDVSPLLARLTAWYEGMLMGRFHPGGRKHFKKHQKKLKPKLVVISREELLRRYLGSG